MKRLIVVFFLLQFTYTVNSQNHIFVLVDISKSITQSQLADAKQELFEIMNNSRLLKSSVSQGNQSDLVNFKLNQGDRLAIVEFGNLQTTLSINPRPVTIQNIASDLNNCLNSISWLSRDLQTYYVLAKAKIAEYAKNNHISQYRLYIISDNIQDDFGPNGKSNYGNDYIRNLAEGYNSSTNPVSETGYTIIKFSAQSDFKLSFSPGVDVSKYNLPPIPPILGGPGGSGSSDNSGVSGNESLKIELTSFKGGTPQKPIVVKDSKFTISWFCKNAPSNAQYNIRLSPIDNPGEKSLVFKSSGNSYNLQNIGDGKWKITVSTVSSNFIALSATTTIEINSGGSMLLLWLLFIAAIAAGSYWYMNKIKEDKLKKLNSIPSDKYISRGSATNTNTNTNTNITSNNTGYF